MDFNRLKGVKIVEGLGYKGLKKLQDLKMYSNYMFERGIGWEGGGRGIE